jgi:hypothetical protein
MNNSRTERLVGEHQSVALVRPRFRLQGSARRMGAGIVELVIAPERGSCSVRLYANPEVGPTLAYPFAVLAPEQENGAVMNRTPKLLKLAGLVLLAGGGLAGCKSGISANGAATTLQALQPVDDAVAKKAQTSCWFKVANRSSERDEVRLWKASSSVGATTGRLGDLLIVSGAMQPAVRDARYYGCSLFEYQPGVPVVMTATAGPAPVRADTVIPFGFGKDGRKNLK